MPHLSTFRTQIWLEVKTDTDIGLTNDKTWWYHGLIHVIGVYFKDRKRNFLLCQPKWKMTSLVNLERLFKFIFEENGPLKSLWFQNLFKKMCCTCKTFHKAFLSSKRNPLWACTSPLKTISITTTNICTFIMKTSTVLVRCKR